MKQFLLCIFLLGVLAAANTSAISVGLPESLADRVDIINVGETVSYDFVVGGDAVVRQVNFFVTPITNGVVQVNGGEKEVDALMLGAYERRTISVDVTGIANGTTSVQVGVVQSAPSGQFAFENVLQRLFDIRVQCVDSSCASEQDVSAKTTTRSARGGGGSGGIVAMPAVRTNSSQATATPPAPVSAPSSPVVSDVGGEQSLDSMQAQAPVVVERLVVVPQVPSTEKAIVATKSIPTIFYVCVFALGASLVLLAVMHRLVRGMSNDDFA